MLIMINGIYRTHNIPTKFNGKIDNPSLKCTLILSPDLQVLIQKSTSKNDVGKVLI